jgi:peroxiredoxin Q/BCP
MATKKTEAKEKPTNVKVTSDEGRPAAGAKAPAFKLAADDGSVLSLSDFAGKNVVLFFYPKDNTPGCTREACSFQENLSTIQSKGAVVLGVSRDSTKSHVGFKTKYQLGFPLLSDPDSSVHKAYGAWGTKTMYGKATTGAIRTTAIIDSKGRIAKIFSNVKVDGHTEKVLAELDALR